MNVDVAILADRVLNGQLTLPSALIRLPKEQKDDLLRIMRSKKLTGRPEKHAMKSFSEFAKSKYMQSLLKPLTGGVPRDPKAVVAGVARDIGSGIPVGAGVGGKWPGYGAVPDIKEPKIPGVSLRKEHGILKPTKPDKAAEVKFPPQSPKKLMKEHGILSLQEEKLLRSLNTKEVGEQIGINWGKVKFKLGEFKTGMNEELEHKDVTGGDPVKTAKITLAHLKEDPKYYTKLDEAMSKKKETSRMRKSLFNAVMDKKVGVYSSIDERNARQRFLAQFGAIAIAKSMEKEEPKAKKTDMSQVRWHEDWRLR